MKINSTNVKDLGMACLKATFLLPHGHGLGFEANMIQEHCKSFIGVCALQARSYQITTKQLYCQHTTCSESGTVFTCLLYNHFAAHSSSVSSTLSLSGLQTGHCVRPEYSFTALITAQMDADSVLKHAVQPQCEKVVGMGLCQYFDLCFYASLLPCLHTFWHAIPQHIYVFLYQLISVTVRPKSEKNIFFKCRFN